MIWFVFMLLICVLCLDWVDCGVVMCFGFDNVYLNVFSMLFDCCFV